MVAPIRQRVATPTTRPIPNVSNAELVSRSPRDWDAEDTAVEAPAAAAQAKRARTRIAVIHDEAPAFLSDAITYACPCSEGNACLRCDAGTAVAAVTLETVNIGSITYDRGAESEERIAEALELVDEEHRERLEWLLRNGPAEDTDALVVEVSAPITCPFNGSGDVQDMTVVEVIGRMVRVAVQESCADFRSKMSAMAQLGPGGGK